ncbi:MAG: GIY-YIG nuclease family protein [Minwuia sp.]|uniref:GIY-YIG nuclease family protein n=1 Tax=Minwuia sp. TaxID=2493630 RepID=UPI003A87E8B5
MRDRTYYVYILTNRTHQTLYIGVTGDLRRRVEEHRQGLSGFTDTYSVRKLVWF